MPDQPAGASVDAPASAPVGVPGGAGPFGAGPDSAGPGSAGPDGAGPDGAGPGSAGPDGAGPGSAGPDSAGPDSAGPGQDGAGAGSRSARAAAVRIAGSRPVRWAFVAATVGLGAYAVISNWSGPNGVGADLSALGAAAVAGAMISVLISLLTLMQVYRVLLGALGSPLPARVAAQILFVGQLGKYLPGSVWPVLAQMELGTAHQVPRRRSASASVLTMLLSLVTGILVGLVMLPFSKSATHYRWVFLVAPLILAGLYPRVLNRVIDWLLRLARRPPLEQPLTGRAVATALAWGVIGWIFYGLQIWLLAQRLGLSGWSGVLLAIGGFAFAWCAGFLVIFAPAGAGVREIVLIGLLGPVIGVAGATAVALVSRVLMTAGDLLSAGVAAWFARRSAPVAAGKRAG
jgi:glycosyltransferase 2 family protein